MSEHYEYKFEHVGGRFVARKLTRFMIRETIVARGQEGWRLVQVMPLQGLFFGARNSFELIFERRVG